MIKTKEKRLNAHECLQHQWLTGDHSHKTLEIARNRFFAIREKIRQKYANWNEFVLPLGRLSEFSSLRKLQTEKYRMQEVLIDRKCAAPRFVIKPQSTFALEGNFLCAFEDFLHFFFMPLRFHGIFVNHFKYIKARKLKKVSCESTVSWKQECPFENDFKPICFY